MVQAPFYQDSPLRSPEALLALLGDFWRLIYDGRDLLQHLLRITGELHLGVLERLAAAIQTESRLQVPVLERPEWYALLLRQDENVGAPFVYGQTDPALTYGGGAYGQVAYGQRQGWAWVVPGDLVEAPLLTDRIEGSRLLWNESLDYTLLRLPSQIGDPGQNLLVCRQDPFAQEAFAARELVRPDGSVTRELTLWLVRPGLEGWRPWLHWGYLLGIKRPSTPAYRALLNVLFDALTTGSSQALFQELLSVVTGLPLARGQETVEAVFPWGQRQHILTDRGLYAFTARDQLTVAEGDSLEAGQTLSTGLLIHTPDWSRDQEETSPSPTPDWLTTLTLEPGLTTVPLTAPLSFADTPEEWTWSVDPEDPDGPLEGRFPVSGFPADVEAFWDAVADRGRALGVSLAETLDLRPPTGRVGLPGVESLPTQVVPRDFLAGTLLRRESLLALIRGDALAWNRPLRLEDDFLRRLLPPGVLFYLLLELPQASSRSSGGSASLAPLTMGEPLVQSQTGGRSRATLRPLQMRCY